MKTKCRNLPTVGIFIVVYSLARTSSKLLWFRMCQNRRSYVRAMSVGVCPKRSERHRACAGLPGKSAHEARFRSRMAGVALSVQYVSSGLNKVWVSVSSTGVLLFVFYLGGISHFHYFILQPWTTSTTCVHKQVLFVPIQYHCIEFKCK